MVSARLQCNSLLPGDANLLGYDAVSLGLVVLDVLKDNSVFTFKNQTI